MFSSLSRILVVDDDLATQMLASAALCTDGFDSTEANGGREALDLFERGEFEAVLVDVNMPDLDGYQVCRAIRALDRGHNTAIMGMTASDRQGDLFATLASMADVFHLGGRDVRRAPLR